MTDRPHARFQYVWRLPMLKAFQLSEDLPQYDLFESPDSEDVWHLTLYVNDETEVPAQLLTELHEVQKLSEKDSISPTENLLQPVTVGNFYIHSQAFPPLENKISLQIEAATAFGSGYHETTQGCLQLIQEIFSQHPWRKAWDLGCGSGILTLAMNALLPGSAQGSDNDADAIIQARHNADINHIPTTFFCQEGFPKVAQSCDFVVSNIVASLLIQWAPLFSHQRHLVLSGILTRQAQEVIDTYASLGWSPNRIITLGDWSSVWVHRP